MQIFSRVQRNIADQKTLTPLLGLGLWIVLYPPLTALYPMFPPLFGIAYVAWRRAIYRADFLTAGLWMLYTLILEVVWGLPLYGTWTVMLTTFALFDPKITYMLHARSLINALSLLFFDGLYMMFLAGYGALMNSDLIDHDPILIYYFLVDLLGAFLL